MAFHGNGILLFAADAPLGGNVFGRNPHVDVVEGVVQGTHHHVHHLGVAHAGTPAHVQRRKRCAAHVLGTTADGDVGITQQNALAGVHDGLQAGAAQTVHVVGGCALTATAIDCNHAAQVHVLGFGVDDVAKHHVAHILAVHIGTGQRFADHLRTQLGGGDVFEAAAKGSDGGSDGADNYNFTGHGDCSWWGREGKDAWQGCDHFTTPLRHAFFTYLTQVLSTLKGVDIPIRSSP